MAKVVIFETNKPAVIIESANTPDYENRSDVVINPDLSSLQAVDRKYWKKSGNTVVEMTQAEKDAVDAARIQAKKDSISGFVSDNEIIISALVKAVNERLNLISNQLNTVTPITRQELITRMKNEVE